MPLTLRLPADDGGNNMYEVTVQASDGGAATTAMEELTIEVTNVEEPGTVMLSTLQPQVDVAITATLTDPDTFGEGDAMLPSISWQWYRGNSEIVGATNTGMIESSYTPTTGDVGSVLRATAICTTTSRTKTRQPRKIRPTLSVKLPSRTSLPTFPDQEPGEENVVTAQTRTVGGEHACGHEYRRSRCSQ